MTKSQKLKSARDAVGSIYKMHGPLSNGATWAFNARHPGDTCERRHPGFLSRQEASAARKSLIAEIVENAK